MWVMKKYPIGEFNSELAAGCAYDHAAICLLGKVAVTNFDWQIADNINIGSKEENSEDIIKSEFIRCLVRKPKRKNYRSTLKKKKNSENKNDKKNTKAPGNQIVAEGRSDQKLIANKKDKKPLTDDRGEKVLSDWWFLNHIPSLPQNVLDHTESIYNGTTLK